VRLSGKTALHNFQRYFIASSRYIFVLSMVTSIVALIDPAALVAVTVAV
jgi:hypothetical protein